MTGIADDAGDSLRITALALDQAGRVLAGSYDGRLRSIDPLSLEIEDFNQRVLFAVPVSSILVDMKGKVWVGTEGAGLHAYGMQGELLAVYRHNWADPGSIGSDSIGDIMEDSLGYLWIGFSSGGIDLHQNGRFSHARREKGLDNRAASLNIPPITSLAEDLKGQIWAGFQDGGIGVLDPSSMYVVVSPFADDVEVSALFKDRRGLLWIGLKSGGLLTGDHRSTAFTRYSRLDEERALGAIVCLDEGPDGPLVAVSRSHGLLLYDTLRDEFVKVSMPDKGLLSDSDHITALMIGSDNSLWTGLSSGLVLRWAFDSLSSIELKGSYTTSPSRQARITSLLEASDGTMWIGTDGQGLFSLAPGAKRAERSTKIPAYSIGSMIQDTRGNVWVGTVDAGLFSLDGGAFKNGSGIGDFRIETIIEDSQRRLWVGTGGGSLVALGPDTGEILIRGNEIGVFGDSVYDIAQDGGGRLWVGSSAGLFSLDPERKEVFLFGKEDGLLGLGLHSGAILPSKDGFLWIASESGLTRFDPDRIQRYAPAPDVVIAEIEPMGREDSIRRSPEGSEIILDYDNRGLGFSIAAIDYAASGRNQYAMRLEGRHSTWMAMGNVNTGFIAPLSPGRYMLRVKAANGNGIWNSYGASLSILVTPPWWGTWWFRSALLGSIAVLVIIILMAIFGGLRRRNALLVKFAHHIEEAREEERKIAARDVHDEIGQHLMVLNFHAYWLASHLKAESEERLPKIKEMQKAILDAMASVKAVATRLRPLALDTLDFPDALRWYLRSFERMSGIETSFEIGDGWKSMSPRVARAFFRIFQETLSNVARHSKALHLHVRFFMEGNRCILETKDDGSGMDTGKVEAQDSFGIIGMKEACASLGGSLVVTSTPGEGTLVRASIPSSEPRHIGSRCR
jgi:signal transduction histidine kinase/ligand-binding sensor domain-containing protein